MVVGMTRYVKGYKVEVLNTKGTLEYSWNIARIVEGHGDVYTVRYDGYTNGGVEERVLVKCIRPCPPVVEFSNWSRGDLVHIFDNFAWKLATVLEALDKKQFLVRVVGSMRDLIVGAAWIRVRHYWQDDQWIVVGKGPSNSAAKRPLTRLNKISDSGVETRNTRRRSTRQKSHNVPTKAIKRSVPSTLDLSEARRGSAKISRTGRRTSPCTLNQNQYEACTGTGTGTKSKVTEEHQSINPPQATNATLREIQHEILEDSYLSSVGSCSINSNCSSHLHRRKDAEHGCDDDLSDAGSCNWPSPKPRNQTASIFVSENAILDRPAERCNLVLRFRLQDSSPRRAPL